MRGGYPSKLQRSVVGCASEGSACLREAASAKAGPTKHVEEPRLRAVTHFGVQARALARGAPLFQCSFLHMHGYTIVNDLDKLTLLEGHCKRNGAIS